MGKKRSEELNTVNIIELFDESVCRLSSYTDTPEGNKEAEREFITSAKKKYDFTEHQLADGIEDGILEKDNYKIMIVHSTT